jgi:site-specific DNA-methyltransferase (adenine-specific)
MAGCPEEGIVFDPFMGAGTTAIVAYKNNRKYLGSDLSSEYCLIAEKRILNTCFSL